MTEQTTQIHGSAVVVDGRGCLIIGASGSGKSALALGLMSHGAELVADDGILAVRRGDEIWIAAQPTLAAAIEVRYVGLLVTSLSEPVRLELVIDLDSEETERLPQQHVHEVLGVELRCLHKASNFPLPSPKTIRLPKWRVKKPRLA